MKGSLVCADTRHDIGDINNLTVVLDQKAIQPNPMKEPRGRLVRMEGACASWVRTGAAADPASLVAVQAVHEHTHEISNITVGRALVIPAGSGKPPTPSLGIGGLAGIPTPTKYQNSPRGK